MKKNYLPLLTGSLFLCLTGYGQSRLVFNNDAYMVIDNGAFVVLENSNTDALTQLGTGGRIVSEAENDRLRWMVGTNTGTYTVPFSTAAGVEIPVSLTITGAGTGAGNITFSTYNGSTWDNNTYRPSDVTHMFDLATGSVNNSNHVIDRFWIIDPLSYTTKPGATLSLTYIDAEHSAAGNTISESNLGAQRFNTGAGVWGDYLPQGTINTATNIVSAIPVTSANFFRSWTLSELNNPLPIELINFEASCASNNKVNVTWTTASESNIDAFVVTGSYNGYDMIELATVQPMNNTAVNQYNLEVNGQYRYYALKTLGDNGTSKVEFMQPLNCGGNSHAGAFVQGTDIVVNLNLETSGPVDITLFDATGKLVYVSKHQASEGNSTLYLPVTLAKGIYFLQVQSLVNELNSTIKLFK